MSERDTEIMEETAKAVYFETGQRLGMPDDALQYNETALWFYDDNLYVMNSLEAHIRFYIRPEIVAQCMVGDTPEGIFPPFYRVIPAKDIDGFKGENGNTRIFFRVGDSKHSALYIGEAAHQFFARHIPEIE